MSHMSTIKDYDAEEPLTSNAAPLTNSTITIRVIKSFPYRNVKSFVLANYNLEAKTGYDLFQDTLKHIQSDGAFRAFRNVEYDAMKVYTHAHGFKTVNLVINFTHDDDPSWVLDIKKENGKKLCEYDIENETEISIYNLAEYEEYKANPIEKW